MLTLKPIKLKSEKHKFMARDNLSVREIYALNAILEHDIRRLALKKNWALSKLLVRPSAKIIARELELIYQECQRVGYVGGMGNTLKYLIEIDPKTRLISRTEGENLFNYMSDQIGQELVSLNSTRQIESNGSFAKAKLGYTEVYMNALKSGNNLNALKALAGIVRCNQACQQRPLLTEEQLNLFKHLSKEVEGKGWTSQLRLIIRTVENSY